MEKRKMPKFRFHFKDMSESCFFGITNLIMVDFKHTQTSIHNMLVIVTSTSIGVPAVTMHVSCIWYCINHVNTFTQKYKNGNYSLSLFSLSFNLRKQKPYIIRTTLFPFQNPSGLWPHVRLNSHKSSQMLCTIMLVMM